MKCNATLEFNNGEPLTCQLVARHGGPHDTSPDSRFGKMWDDDFDFATPHRDLATLTEHDTTQTLPIILDDDTLQCSSTQALINSAPKRCERPANHLGVHLYTQPITPELDPEAAHRTWLIEAIELSTPCTANDLRAFTTRVLELRGPDAHISIRDNDGTLTCVDYSGNHDHAPRLDWLNRGD